MLTCVTDLAFGDAGKGKIVDHLANDYDILVRFNGGPNAGHTVVINEEKKSLHNLPSGLFVDNPPSTTVLCSGMVINPVSLLKEIEEFKPYIRNLILSHKIHCIMPWHIQEDIEKTAQSIGTTRQGIGPCYADKMLRINAVRLGYLQEFLDGSSLFEAEIIKRCGKDYFYNNDIKKIYNDYSNAIRELSKYIGDDGFFLRSHIDDNILFECANGIHLDIDHGSYPFVTSSGCGPAFIPQSCGLPNIKLDKIVGITKAYTTRVGTGSLDTELHDGFEQVIRDIGHEYGTTTGRARRIGWLDLDKVKEGIALTGTTHICITHIDTIMNACKEVGYTDFSFKANGSIVQMPIWNSVSIEDENLLNFITFVENFTSRKVAYLGTGRDRKNIIETDGVCCD